MNENPFERARNERALARALERLSVEVAEKEGAERFEQLKAHLAGEGPSPVYGDLAEAWGVRESAARLVVHRLRKRLGRLLREESR